MSIKQPDKGYYKNPNEALHERLAETHDRLVSIEVAMRDRVDPAIESLRTELNALSGLTEKGFSPQYISVKIDKIEATIIDYELRLVIVESETTRAHARVTDIEKVVAEDRKVTRSTERRVSALEAMSFPFIGFLFAIIAGIVASWLWSRHDFSSTFMVGGQTGNAKSAADLLICAVLFGIGVGLAVLAIVALFYRVSYRYRMGYEAEERREHERSEVLSEVSTTSTSEAAPTKVKAIH